MAESLAAWSPLCPEPWTIRARREDTADTFTLELQRAAGGSFRFAPGQFNMLYAPGIGEVAISISGDPADDHRLVHTIRTVGAVTRALRGGAVGTSIGVRGPFGHGWPLEAALTRHVVIVAGGIGLAPLRPVLLALAAAAATRASRGLRTAVYVGTRTPADLLYPREIAAWSELPGVMVRTTVDRAEPGWTGAVGLVTALIRSLPGAAEETLALTCGPEIMMRVVATRLMALGLDERGIYLSAERNMKCAVGNCGHCQYGPLFVCRDGPVFPFPRLAPLLRVREI